MWYIRAYRKLYSAESVDPDFPPDMLEIFNKYPKCQENLKKLMCGEFFPPCFPEEGKGFYSICRSVCNEILRDCPEFFRYFMLFLLIIDDKIKMEYVVSYKCSRFLGKWLSKLAWVTLCRISFSHRD